MGKQIKQENTIKQQTALAREKVQKVQKVHQIQKNSYISSSQKDHKNKRFQRDEVESKSIRNNRDQTNSKDQTNIKDQTNNRDSSNNKNQINSRDQTNHRKASEGKNIGYRENRGNRDQSANQIEKQQNKSRDYKGDHKDNRDSRNKQGKSDRSQNNAQENKGENKGEKESREKRIKRHRIIIRNLIFDVNQNHIKKLILPFGASKQISMPMNQDRKNCNKGFAFVEFQNEHQCEKAIKKLNNTIYKGRTIIVDYSVSKQRYLQSNLEKEDPANESIAKKEEEKGIKVEDQKIQEEENESEKIEPNHSMQEEQEQPSKHHQAEKPEQDLSSTVFIRNLPQTMTEDKLFKYFRKYGKLHFAKVVMDKEKNTPKGTAFVKFYDSETAQRLIEYSRSYELFLLKKHFNFTPNPSINLELDGTIVKLFPVVSRVNIEEKIKARNDQTKQTDKKPIKPLKKVKKLEDLIKFDTEKKRKLYLGQYGHWKASEEMRENDYTKFKAHEKEKIQKLKNPNNSISDTRIILKFLSKDITEVQLKDLCFEFIREQNLKKSSLTYCKLMLTDNMTKSAGFAFVEFRKHETSLEFLEWLCESPEKLMKYPFVCEFAIQDSRKMLKLKNRNKKDD